MKVALHRLGRLLACALVAGAGPAAAGGLAGAAAAQPSATTACASARGRVLRVGPGQTYATIGAAARDATSGDVVIISAGDYLGDVATWPQNDLTICGAGGRARLFAQGRQAAGKGIWVIQGARVVVDSVEFHDAKVPDRNGAGIRAEGRGLTIINAGFYDNENGILGPGAGELTIVRSEFARNGFGDGQSHNLYVGAADRLTVLASFFHEARIGHNLKSRARETRIENSYFMDGADGTASYQIDVPNGGLVFLRGNLIQKGPRADNATLISYGSEGLRSGVTHTLTLVHNTLVSTYPGGSFIFAAPGVQSVVLKANLFAGTGAPPKINGAAWAKVVEDSSLVTTADPFGAATRIDAPDFWPSDGLLAQTLLSSVPDPTYVDDAPRPYRLRAVVGATRRIGALQRAP